MPATSEFSYHDDSMGSLVLAPGETAHRAMLRSLQKISDEFRQLGFGLDAAPQFISFGQDLTVPNSGRRVMIRYCLHPLHGSVFDRRAGDLGYGFSEDCSHCGFVVDFVAEANRACRARLHVIIDQARNQGYWSASYWGNAPLYSGPSTPSLYRLEIKS
jgi:hypothetical protein